MKVYITPDQVETFSRKFNNAVKHLTPAPSISFSEPKPTKVTTVEIIDRGWGGIGRTHKYVELVEVDIEDVKCGDWILVANVFHQEHIITMVDAKHYGDIPSKFGFDYNKCDYCNHIHHSRKLSHIIYNTSTGEWKQIGSTCVTKMFGAEGYFSKFTVQLNNIIEICFGCCDPDMVSCWCASLPDRYMQTAIRTDLAVGIAKKYIDEVSNVWIKSSYDYESRTKIPGTTHFLNEYFDKITEDDGFDADAEFAAAVKSYIASLQAKSEFVANVKTAMENDYMCRADMYAAFFACKMYIDSLTAGDWYDIKSKFTVGEKTAVKNAVAVGSQEIIGMFGVSTLVFFKTDDDVTFAKSFSADYEQYKNADGTYSFIAKVGGFDDKKRIVVLSGRASKMK